MLFSSLSFTQSLLMKLLKLLILMALALPGGFQANAQNSNFNYFNAGVGISGYGLPVYAGIDYTVADRISVGAMASVNWRLPFGNFWWGGGNGYRSVYGIGVNGNYHFLDPGDEFDLYAGLSAGYNIARFRIVDGPGVWNTRSEGWPFLGVQVGGRATLDNGIIVHAEIGGGNFAAALRVGVSFPI